MTNSPFRRDLRWWAGWLLLLSGLSVLDVGFKFWRNDPRSLPRPDGSHLQSDEGVTHFPMLERHSVLAAIGVVGSVLVAGSIVLLGTAPRDRRNT